MSKKKSKLPSSPLHSSPSARRATEQDLLIRSNPLFRRRRNLVLACAVAVITIAGTLFGARLKIKRQVAVRTIKEQHEIDAEHVAKQISLLETTRGQLWQQKTVLEHKIEDLNARRAKKAVLEQQKRSLMDTDSNSERIER